MRQGLGRRAGHPTTVWNRTTSKADQLVAEGARLAPTVGDALKAGSLTIICVTDYQAMHELLGASDIKLNGTMLINLTSGDLPWAGRGRARQVLPCPEVWAPRGGRGLAAG
ncbi:NAD(P)-binding domain-containing protein [Streptosporangium sp. NBC_01755]|uniref:NAD(P)-binding domain-containing protein n=1 Tax=Streptosporangium sp. NBC_01755 TaxID=2975949 RepID=UPI002DD7B564|nr:NAD(P)-binding domain-containing protein [Streptosporangium sp. NBC_01755]WSD02561.1 NAD(P)-binding domain-containing protein [Streptosporangium sp. NBC_01755]